MFSPMGNSNPQDLGNGGEIDGNLSITGDLTVSGGIGLTLSEVIQGTSTIDVTNTEALLVRKDGDGGDVFVVNTTDSKVRIDGKLGINMTPDSSTGGMLDIQATDHLKLRFYNSTNFKAGFEVATSSGDMITGSATNDFCIRNQSNILFAAGSATERMRISSNGKTGVGTNNPQSLFVVSDGGNTGFEISPSDSSNLVTLLSYDRGESAYKELAFNTQSVDIRTNGSTSALTIDSSQNVGIGIASFWAGEASAHTEISATKAGDYTGLILRNENTDAGDSVSLNFGLARDGGLNFGNAGKILVGKEADFTTTPSTVDSFMAFYTILDETSSEKMRLTSGGKLGVGVSSINGAFTVLGTPMTAVGHQTVADIFGNVQQDADKGAGIGLGGRYITNADSVTAFAEILGVKANNTSANYEGEMVFKTRVNGGNQTERMRLNSTGLGIGVSSGISAKLDVDGSAIVGRTRDIGSYASDDFDLMVTNGNNDATVIALYNDAGAFHTGLIEYYNNSLSIGLNNSNSDDSLLTNTAIVLDANSRISLSNNDASGAVGTTLFGYDAGNNIASGGTNSTFFGHQSGTAVTTGDHNTAYGYRSLFDIVDGGYNTALGSFALGGVHGTTADISSENVAIGYSAMGNNFDDSSSTNYCVAVGAFAMNGALNNPNGTVAIGYKSLTALTSGAKNVAIGYKAGETYNGNNSVIIGHEAGLNMDSSGSTATNSTLIGMEAGKELDDGTYNVAIGEGAMRSNSGGGNTAIRNTAIGWQAADLLRTGSDNVVIGHNAEVSATDAVNQIAIGKEAVGQANNSVTLGNDSVTAVYMASDSGAKVHMGDFHLQNPTSFTFNDNASHELCSFEARFTDSPNGSTGTHIAFRQSADDFTSGTETARIANIGASGNINFNHSSTLEFHVISGHTMTKMLTVGSNDGHDRVLLNKGRLQFPDSQNADSDANTLDDYEEGTWSPVICQSDDVSDVLPMHAETAGNYTKIGNVVHVTGQAIGNSSSGDMVSGDTIAIKGLPFAVPNAQKNRSVASVIGLTVNLASGKRIAGYVSQNTSQINLYVNDGTSEGLLLFSEFTNAGHIIFQATYLI